VVRARARTVNGLQMQFSEHVARLTAQLYGDEADYPAAHIVEFRYATDGARIDEASRVDGVAEAFADAELRPPIGSKGLGVRRRSSVKALGIQLGRKHDHLTGDQTEAALDAVRAALACGYIVMTALQRDGSLSMRSDLDAERVWAVAVGNFRADGVRTFGVNQNVIDHLDRHGAEALVGGLLVDGVVEKPTARLVELGGKYAQAGAMVRAAQTDMSLPPAVETLARAAADQGPYSAYATAPRSAPRSPGTADHGSGLVTGAVEAMLMDCLMGAGFDPHELMALSHEQHVELVRQAVADGRVPAEVGDTLINLKPGPMTTDEFLALVDRVNPASADA